MIHQFAIEPSCLSGWERVRFVLSQFGPGCGRLIVELPRDWLASLQKQVLDLPPEDRMRVEERLKRATNEQVFCLRSQARFDTQKSWIQNALIEHRRQPLASILATKESAANQPTPPVLRIEDLDDKTPGFAVERTGRVSRTPKDIARCVAPLLQLGGEVHLVDQYLVSRPQGVGGAAFLSRRHLDVLESMFASAPPVSRVHYHAGDSNELDVAEAVRQIRSKLPRDLHAQLTLWPPRSLHNRFVLTSFGAIEFGHGLDWSPNMGQMDDVSLLDREHWQERLSMFHNQPAGARSFVIPTPAQQRRDQLNGGPRGTGAGSRLNIPARGS